VQDVKSVKCDDLRDALLAEYISKNKGSVDTKADGSKTISGLNHLTAFFGGWSATRITTDAIRKYIEVRRIAGAADPTIRRNLVLLRTMLNMARKEGKLRLSDVPYFPMPKDSDPAGQYIDPATFKALLVALPKNLHTFFNFQYHTGCRVGATQAITWEMVSRDATVIQIPAELMKARAPLSIALTGAGLEPIAAMLKKKFRQDDSPVFETVNFRDAWQKAAVKVGIGKLDDKGHYTGARIHDLRCSAAINLVDAGVAEDVVMKIGGWKTKAMFSRYNVMNLDRLKAAMVKGGAYVADLAAQG
jgi:integrase